MSYASLIGDVDKEHNKEIVQERVPISAYGEATQGDIRLHIHPPVDIGPATLIKVYDDHIEQAKSILKTVSA